jgi:hypothetical protein
MLKQAFLSCCLFGIFSAQSIAQNIPNTETLYCELTSQPKAFSGGKIKVKADFGQPRNFTDRMWLLDKSTNKPKVFNSMIDALNYMSKDGWVLVSTHPEIDLNTVRNHDHLPPASSAKTYRCILKKDVPKR